MTVEQALQKVQVNTHPGQLQFRSPAPMPFKAFVEERRAGHFRLRPDPPGYALPVDDNVRRTLGLIPFGLRLDDLLEKIVQVQIGPLIHNALRVSPRQLPHVYRVVDRCANTLGIAVPRVLVIPDVRINALTVGTNENHFIMVTSAMVDKCSEKELMFLIGHECGHIHCQHLSYLALARALGEWAVHLMPFAQMLSGPIRMLFQVPLAAWQRTAEFTCDRAGLICSGELEPSLRALAKQILQSEAIGDDLDLGEYLAQIETAADESTLSKLPEYFTASPFVPKRMGALKLFSRSELYYDLNHLPKPPDLLDREELEKQTVRVSSIL